MTLEDTAFFTNVYTHSPESVKKMLFEKNFASPWISSSCEWESQFLVDPKKTRKALFDSFYSLSSDPELWSSIMVLWENKSFDSTSKTAITVHGITVVCQHFLPLKDEVDISSTYSESGRSNLSHSNLANGWGLGRDQMIAVRGKINGMSFVKSQKADGKWYLCGPWDIEVHKDFPVTKAEFYGGSYYIVTPYGLPSFTHYYGSPTSFSRCFSFVEHPWLHPSDFVNSVKYDGIMVLTDLTEFRTKFNPTHEHDFGTVDASNVWEVLSVNKDIRLRQRPGKIASYTGAIAASLSSVTSSHLISTFPLSRSYSIVTNSYGPIKSSGRSSGHYFIDSGYRRLHKTLVKNDGFTCDIGIPDPLVKDIVITESSADLVIGEVVTDPRMFAHPGKPTNMSDIRYKSYVGSKVIVQCGQTWQFLMIKEKGKLIDHIGGMREAFEDPQQTIEREIKEELGFSLPNLRLLGVSESKEFGAFARTHVFFCRLSSQFMSSPLWNDIEDRIVRTDLVFDNMIMQPWVKRINTWFIQLLDNSMPACRIVRQNPGITLKDLIERIPGLDVSLPILYVDVFTDQTCYSVKHVVDCRQPLLQFFLSPVRYEILNRSIDGRKKYRCLLTFKGKCYIGQLCDNVICSIMTAHTLHETSLKLDGATLSKISVTPFAKMPYNEEIRHVVG